MRGNRTCGESVRHKVALLLRQPIDGHALASVLKPHFDIDLWNDIEEGHLISPPSLLVIDGMMLWHHRDWLLRQREGNKARKLFVLLLLASGRSKTWPEERYRQCYDDVLLAPLDRNEILLRVTQLLDHRAAMLSNINLLSQAQVATETLRAERIRREHLIMTLGHDLRSPLTAARIGVERLKPKLAESKYVQRAERILLALDRINIMIEELLEAGRIEKLQATNTWQECHLPTLVNKTLSDLTTLYGDRFQTELSPNLGVIVQEDKIVRVLENLCGNAIKYGDASMPVVIQGFAREGQVNLQVANHGDPLPEKTVTSLFETFTRAEMNEKSNFISSFRIGLAMVKEVAHSHGGHILAFRDEQARNVFGIQFPKFRE